MKALTQIIGVRTSRRGGGGDGGNGKERFTGDKGEARGEGMGGHEHVHGGEWAAPLPRGGAEVGIGFCGGGVPGQNADAQEELID